MKVGDLVRLGDSWLIEDRVLGIITRIYEYQSRPCCDVFFADTLLTGELIYLSELEAINESR